MFHGVCATPMPMPQVAGVQEDCWTFLQDLMSVAGPWLMHFSTWSCSEAPAAAGVWFPKHRHIQSPHHVLSRLKLLLCGLLGQGTPALPSELDPIQLLA